MRVTRWPVALIAIAAFVVGCSGDDPEPRSKPHHSASPTHASDVAPISEGKLKTLARFLDKAKPVHEGEVGPRYKLERVIYTSPTDAAAELL